MSISADHGGPPDRPDPDKPKDPHEPDHIPDTPPTEPPPIPIRDPRPDSEPPGPLISRRLTRIAALVVVAQALSAGPASAQGRDGLLNGAIIGAAIGAGVGVGLNYALRDSDLTVGQYAYPAAVFGAIGAGIGLGVDALFSRSSPRGTSAPPPRLLFAPAVWRNVAHVTVRWRW
jgi:hypothetical protein